MYAYGGTAAVGLISGTGHGIFQGDWSILANSGKIFLGNFYLDGNRDFLGEVWQGISRHSWELPQTTVGHGYSQLRNAFDRVDRVDYFGGATFSTNENYSRRWGVSIGNFINLGIGDNISHKFGDRVLSDPLFMHEYGHTFDSQLFGASYLLAIGIPSASGGLWTELRANRHAARYFGKYFNVDWTPYVVSYPLHR